MQPHLRAIMPSSVALIMPIGVSMLASSALIQSSRVQLRKSPGGGPPALLIGCPGQGRPSARPRTQPGNDKPTISVTVISGIVFPDFVGGRLQRFGAAPSA